MPAPRRIRKPMPLRGYRPSWPADSIGQDYSPNCRNVRFRFGEARAAPGRENLSGPVDPSGGTKPQEIVQFYMLDGVTVWPLLLTATKLYRFGGAAPSIPKGQWHNVPGNFTPTGISRWSTTSGEGRFFFVNGDTIGQWDGVVGNHFDRIITTDGSTVPKARFITYFNGRVVVAYTTEAGNVYSNRVRWAQNGDYTKWDDAVGLGAGFLDVQDENQEPIRGIAGLAEELTLYNRRSIKHLIPTGTLEPTFTVQTRVRGIGCDAPYTIGSTGQMHFFLAYDRNVWMWDGLNPRPVGLPIWDELRAVVQANKMDTYFGKVFSTREEYWLVIGSDVFVYDYIRDSWTRDSLPNLTCVGEVEETIDALRWIDLVGSWEQQTLTWQQLAGFSRTALFGGLSSGGTMKLDDSIAYDYFAIGSIVDRFLETEDMYLGRSEALDGDPMRMAVILRMALIYKYLNNVPFEVSISTDRGQNWATQQVVPNQSGISLIDWVVSGEVVRFRFRENNAMGQFRWSSYEFEYNDAGDYIGTGTYPTGIGQSGPLSVTLTITQAGAGSGVVTSDV